MEQELAAGPPPPEALVLPAVHLFDTEVHAVGRLALDIAVEGSMASTKE